MVGSPTTAQESSQESAERWWAPVLRNALEPWHVLVIVLVVVVLFGSKKLPDTARALGKSLRILKSETRALKDDTATAGPPSGAQGDPAGTPTPAPRNAVDSPR
ncbi:hypothetical protein BLA24_24765 [Streptomyces cinnamoneus]|uniref:Sec-independent protein translocase protein TatA n=1 Tax=Streptomyces cinnamoneus TaxID=53446 RepID=A0A2G1XDF9_STRCJ|nr:hypothetical protein BLA24_24765 [Streptomyces cinnamoneus]PPT15075.1 twin-arginine translocase TatA/TatE family subunit [Streptomyces cinnamoneus]